YRVRMVASQAKRLSALRPSMPQPGLGRPRLGYPVFSPLQKTVHGELGKIDLLVIAASTGGPVAIQRVLSQIPASCKIPVLLLQHMPKNFTKSFAERLNQLCKIKVKEAEEGDKLQAGTALLGPGGMQMQIRQGGGGPQIMLRAKQDGELYSPCVDITFTSLAEEFSGRILAVVLTGMGSDGKEGGIRLKQRGAQVWAQDEASSTIYGMPGAIVDANIADKVYSLDEIANEFKKLY
ncbi:MAG: chemotaxis protein CheB, partial [Methylomonas sp.]